MVQLILDMHHAGMLGATQVAPEVVPRIRFDIETMKFSANESSRSCLVFPTRSLRSIFTAKLFPDSC
jgi:hypothetical protein